MNNYSNNGFIYYIFSTQGHPDFSYSFLISYNVQNKPCGKYNETNVLRI